MDRLLRDIQVELAPDRDPPPVLDDEPVVRDVPPAPEPPEPPEAPVPRPVRVADPEDQVLTELTARLLASMRELLAGYERILVGRPVPRPIRRSGRRPSQASDVTLSAAPFKNLDALQAFEQAVSELPGVREVAVQGYEGADRAIIAVRLDQRSP